MNQTLLVITSSIGYPYDVPSLPSGAEIPAGIRVKEIDIYLETMSNAIANFDKRSSAALKGASIIHELKTQEVDIMPREEIFLISSFILNLRQAVLRIYAMPELSRSLLNERNKRGRFKRLFLPDVQRRKWLFSGGADDESLPVAGRTAARQGTGHGDKVSEDTQEVDKIQGKRGLRRRFPFSGLQYLKRSKNPEAISTINHPSPPKYPKQNRRLPKGPPAPVYGSLTRRIYFWAVFQLVYVTEMSIGMTVMAFALRAVGMTIGCAWGYFAYAARKGDPYVASVIACIGIIPFTYVRLATKYINVGQVSIVSLSVVLLATKLATIPGTATEIFFKRTIAFLIGSVAGLIMEVVFIPVKARTRMIESIATAIDNVSNMEVCVANGIDDINNFDAQYTKILPRYGKAVEKAKLALAAAETFHPVTTLEPRLKGSFKTHAKIYEEIIFVLHQIIDRMDNMVELRKTLGSDVLEQFNPLIYQYPRELASAVTLTLFTVREGLTTKSALPQFLPSARLAHLRMINRVREVVTSQTAMDGKNRNITQLVRTRAVRRRFLAWNAGSAAQIEIVEYLEELIDLVKLLVGANEFRSGMLMRPNHRHYLEPREVAEESTKCQTEGQDRDKIGLRDRRGTSQRPCRDSDKQFPDSLQQIHSKNKMLK
ncbi:MAG: hypothetical protein M1814_001758 [Vezdaea aestivalis]|nr:MAG: hypothetical protein M1814_001758 [Vezdaea aestivalis]